MAEILGAAGGQTGKERKDEKDYEGGTTTLTLVAPLATAGVSVAQRELHDSYGQEEPRLRAADIDVGKAILVAGDGQIRGLLVIVIDAEKDQFVDIEIGVLKLFVLEGAVEVVTEHWLEAVERLWAGSPQTTRLEGFNRARGEADVQVTERKRRNLAKSTKVPSLSYEEQTSPKAFAAQGGVSRGCNSHLGSRSMAATAVANKEINNVIFIVALFPRRWNFD